MKAEDFINILKKLNHYQKQEWSEIYQNKHNHKIENNTITCQALKVKLQEEDLYQIQITQKSRLLRFREKSIFYIIAYDREDKIYIRK